MLMYLLNWTWFQTCFHQVILLNVTRRAEKHNGGIRHLDSHCIMVCGIIAQSFCFSVPLYKIQAVAMAVQYRYWEGEWLHKTQKSMHGLGSQITWIPFPNLSFTSCVASFPIRKVGWWRYKRQRADVEIKWVNICKVFRKNLAHSEHSKKLATIIQCF